MLTKVALRSLANAFERQPQADEFEAPTCLLRPPGSGDAASVSWDLPPARQEIRAWTLSWSVATLLGILDTPEKRRRLFPTVSEVSPFTQVNVHVINRVPYDPHFLRRVVVDVRYSGASGVPEFRNFTFDGTVDLRTFSAFYPAAAADFQLAYRISTALAPPKESRWP